MPRTTCPHCRMRIRTADPPLHCPRCLARGMGHFELVALTDPRMRGGQDRVGSHPGSVRARTRPALRLEQTVIWAESRQISVRGELDHAGVDALRRLLADTVGSGLPCVVLDLSTCEFRDPGAFGVIVGLERRLAANGQELVVDGATGQVERLIELARAFLS
jgi:anti-anti-sigma factor